MAADWCMVFKVFDLLLLSFLHKNTSEDRKKFLKVLKRGMEGKKSKVTAYEPEGPSGPSGRRLSPVSIA